MKKPVYYRGRGHDELYNYVQTNGILSGNIVRNTGDHVAGVEISIQNNELILEVDGQTFSSITNAFLQLTKPKVVKVLVILPTTLLVIMLYSNTLFLAMLPWKILWV
jgi:hypothetical protein